MTKEDCLKELAQPELPRERAAYLLGYLKALDEGEDFLPWVHVQLNPELAERYPRRMARIAARLGSKAET